MSNNQKLSNGQLFVSMLVNAMSYVSKPMYLSPSFFRNVDVKTLFGENFDVSYLNDDAFGRLLDGLFHADVSKLFVELSFSCMKKLLSEEPCVALVIAFLDFEWTVRRCILALGKSTTKDIRAKFSGNLSIKVYGNDESTKSDSNSNYKFISSLRDYNELWKAEVKVNGHDCLSDIINLLKFPT